MKENNQLIHQYMARIGRIGGRRSRRRLDPDTARQMVKVREARRAFARFHIRCFWSTRPDYRVVSTDIPWVAEMLMRYGGRDGWELGARLCR